MKTLHSTKSIVRSPLERSGFILITLAIAWFAVSPTVKSEDIYDDVHVTPFGVGALHNGTFDIDFNYTGPAMYYNTAVGSHALYSNDAGGNYNSGFGAYSLYHNTGATYNTAGGFKALFSNTSGVGNTALGALSLYSNSSASQNTAVGYGTLRNNTNVGQSTAVGFQALMNTTSGRNSAFGAYALFHNNGGIGNVGVGGSALVNNTSGSYNVGLGENAGGHITTGTGNVCIGTNVFGIAGESNTTRIRNVYSSIASGRIVYVNSDNKIGTLASTRRVKENIKPMDKASEAILALKPVTFRYKKQIDASGTPQFGLVAEDVANVNPDLVSRDADGKPETVRYDSINAMLLNEFLKEHRKVEELQAARLTEQKEIADLRQQLKEQAAAIQNVSDQLELSRRSPQVADNR